MQVPRVCREEALQLHTRLGRGVTTAQRKMTLTPQNCRARSTISFFFESGNKDSYPDFENKVGLCKVNIDFANLLASCLVLCSPASVWRFPRSCSFPSILEISGGCEELSLAISSVANMMLARGSRFAVHTPKVAGVRRQGSLFLLIPRPSRFLLLHLSSSSPSTFLSPSFVPASVILLSNKF